MQPEQKIIANWIERTGKARGWSGEEWADRANVSTSTVTRAVKDNYHSVTTVLTLDKLARAAGVSFLSSVTGPAWPRTTTS